MKIVLNGKKRQVRGGSTVLEAAVEAGIDIPALCMHDDLTPYGACRLCVVEVREKRRKRWRVVASCLYPVSEGLEVRTDTERIARHRKVLLELMIARCPGAPALRELARRYGVKRTRFAKGEDDCIMCGLCVRVCSEVVGADAIGFASRGVSRRVDTPFGIDHRRCIACGACTAVCPTGAIQMEYNRVIDLRRSESEHPCRYALMGILSHALCSMNYECARCEIDQRMRERFGEYPIFAVRRTRAGKDARKGGRRKQSSKTGRTDGTGR